MTRAKQSRPTREEILKGIDYQPLVMGKGVPECVRAAEDRRLQDYIVNWTQALYDHLEKVEVAAAGRKPAKRKPPKVAQASKRHNPRPAERASAKPSPSRDRPKQISLKKTRYPSAYFTPGQCALLDMPNPHGYTLGERMLLSKGPRRALLIAEGARRKPAGSTSASQLATSFWAPPLYEATACLPQFSAPLISILIPVAV